MKAYYCSTRLACGGIEADDTGTIIRAPPIWKRYIGNTLTNFIKLTRATAEPIADTATSKPQPNTNPLTSKGAIMDEVVNQLLGSIPTGDVVRDPREGEYNEATFKGVELIEQSNGHALKLTFGNMLDTNDREFEHQERITVPTTNSEDFIHRIFLAWLHDLELVPRTFRNRLLADTDEDRMKLLSAFQGKIGATLPTSLKADNSGYIRMRVIRRKKAQ